MKAELSNRGFGFIMGTVYDTKNKPEEKRIVSESSAIGDYEDSMDKPGSSYLWLGDDHHLGREEVEELVTRLQGWLTTGKLLTPEEQEVQA